MNNFKELIRIENWILKHIKNKIIQRINIGIGIMLNNYIYTY